MHLLMFINSCIALFINGVYLAFINNTKFGDVIPGEVMVQQGSTLEN